MGWHWSDGEKSHIVRGGAVEARGILGTEMWAPSDGFGRVIEEAIHRVLDAEAREFGGGWLSGERAGQDAKTEVARPPEVLGGDELREIVRGVVALGGVAD